MGRYVLASLLPRRLRASHKGTVGIDILAPPYTLTATTNAPLHGPAASRGAETGQGTSRTRDLLSPEPVPARSLVP